MKNPSAKVLRVGALSLSVTLISYQTYMMNMCGIGWGSSPKIALMAAGMMVLMASLTIAMMMQDPSERRRNIAAGILLTLSILGTVIGIHSFEKENEQACQWVCRNNRDMINSAKNQYAKRHDLPDGATVSKVRLSPYISVGLPECQCPNQGVYTINPIGTAPECSVHGTLE